MNDGPPRGHDGPLFSRALARVREVLSRAPAPEQPGYRLFWVAGGRDVGWRDLPARGAYAILGSHEQCDVVLRGDARVALRHLLATTIELADGLALRLLDLQTGVPFTLEDGAPRRSIVACGPVVAALGSFVVGGLPASPDGVELPDAAPALAIEDSAVLPASVRAPPTLLPARRLDAAVSYVTSMPPPSSIVVAAARSGRPSLDFDAGGESEGNAPVAEPERPWARVTLRHRDKSASVDLGRAALEVGVLIGRLPTCHDARLLDVLNGGISRGHVLLFRHHDACEAFDLCSTQGTFLGARRVRRVRLDPGGTALQLASKEPVALEWSGG